MILTWQRPFERAREIEADVAAARDHDLARRIVELAHLAQHGTGVLARREEEHLVAFLDDGVAVGDDAFAAAVDRDHAAFDVRDVLRQVAQRMADERAAAIGARRDEPHSAVGELEHLQRAGEPDQLRDVVGDERRRADRDVDGYAAGAEQRLVGDQRTGANARDSRRRAEQRQRDLAGEHVDLVAARERDQHVGVARAGPLEHVGMRGVADDRAHVEPVLQLAQHVGVAVDDRDLVGLLAGQAESGRAADLPGA